METNKLYRVNTRSNLGSKYTSFFVIAKNTDLAYKRVKKYLDDKKIGSYNDRELESVQFLAEESDFPNCEKILLIQVGC